MNQTEFQYEHYNMYELRAETGLENLFAMYQLEYIKVFKNLLLYLTWDL